MLSQHFLLQINASKLKNRTPKDRVTKTIEKIFEKNLRLHIKHCSRGKVQYLIFSNFSLVLTIFSFWEEE